MVVPVPSFQIKSQGGLVLTGVAVAAPLFCPKQGGLVTATVGGVQQARVAKNSVTGSPEQANEVHDPDSPSPKVLIEMLSEAPGIQLPGGSVEMVQQKVQSHKLEGLLSP